MKVLVVEDDSLQRDNIAAALRAAGNEVVAADSGEAALALSGASDFDLVMMDLRLPGIGGVEAARRIRAMSGQRSLVPIVAMSGNLPPEGKVPIPPMDGFIDKRLLEFPIQLATAMTDAVTARRRAETAPPTTDDGVVRISRAWAMALFGMLFTVAGLIGGGSWYLSNQANEERHLGLDVAALRGALDSDRTARENRSRGVDTGLADNTHAVADFRAQVSALHDAIVDIDRRLNAITADATTARRDADATVAALHEDISVIKAQAHFAADRAVAPPIPGPRESPADFRGNPIPAVRGVRP